MLATSSPPDEIDSDGETTIQEKRWGYRQTRCSYLAGQRAEHGIQRERKLAADPLQELNGRSRDAEVGRVYLIGQP